MYICICLFDVGVFLIIYMRVECLFYIHMRVYRLIHSKIQILEAANLEIQKFKFKFSNHNSNSTYGSSIQSRHPQRTARWESDLHSPHRSREDCVYVYMYVCMYISIRCVCVSYYIMCVVSLLFSHACVSFTNPLKISNI